MRIVPRGFWCGVLLILSLIELVPVADRRERILELLRFSADQVRAKRGCLGAGVYEDADENQNIVYLERWASREEFHHHIQSNLYLGVLNAIDLGKGPPMVNFHEVSKTTSMELIATLRL
jgi:quinol monooxygenase YgiN